MFGVECGKRRPCSVIRALASPMKPFHRDLEHLLFPHSKPRKVCILAISAHSVDGKSKVMRGGVEAVLVSRLCSPSSHSSSSPSEESPTLQLRVSDPAPVGYNPSFLLFLILRQLLCLILIDFSIVTVDTVSRHISCCQRPNIHCTKHVNTSG